VETSDEDKFGRACESVTGGTELRSLLNRDRIHSELGSHSKAIGTRYGRACLTPGKMLPVTGLLCLGISFELELSLKPGAALSVAMSLIQDEFQNETKLIDKILCASQT
jgi:hypothetical protein